ncbi:MAG: beta-ketoacyl-ACP synthase II [Martelella sp.]|uniref:beta-ketoacyl-ACP synthase II n=1 Tax=Martelella sp. TaxID=1969699 RepID=UPI003241C6FF
MFSDDPIVITGMGAVSPLGVGVDVNWSRLIAARSGIVANTRFDTEAYGCKVAGLVPAKTDDPDGFDPLDFIEAKELKKMDLFIQYSLGATDEALRQAGWMPEDEVAQSRTGVVIATGVGGFPAITDAVKTVEARGPRRLSPFTVPSFLPNLAAGHVAILYGFHGPSGCPVTACAASAQAIGDGMRMIAFNEADIVVCGGTDACVDPVSIGGFGAARALSTHYNDDPAAASRPFDKGHDGFVLSEGAATVVIERLSHARARGAEPLAIVAGYGTSTDAHHLTAGHPEGRYAAAAMCSALAMAKFDAAEIDYINAHSTSTPVGDAAEIAAIGSVFPERGKDLAVTSTKSATGHLLGAAGAIEAVFSVMALRDGIIPPGLNIHDPEAAADRYDLAPLAAKEKPIRHVLSNGFGFGGVNAALVFSKSP